MTYYFNKYETIILSFQLIYLKLTNETRKQAILCIGLNTTLTLFLLSFKIETPASKTYLVVENQCANSLTLRTCCLMAWLIRIIRLLAWTKHRESPFFSHS